MPHNNAQTTDQLLMVRPVAFHYNDQTACSNDYMSNSNLSEDEQHYLALQEFERLVNHLSREGISVEVVNDTLDPITPDSIFPNNWISTHESQQGTVITYAMEAINRRLERRKDIVDLVLKKFLFANHLALEIFEEKEQFLEGTGSMVLDREHKIAYACRSSRTHMEPLYYFCKRMGFEPVLFDSLSGHGTPIYHSNVMMAVGRGFVAICLESVQNPVQRRMLREHFEKTNKKVIELSPMQIDCFAGNMLEVKNTQSDPFVAMSESAWQSLDRSQRRDIERFATPLPSAIPTIEKHAGGSVRCMIAEIFYPQP